MNRGRQSEHSSGVPWAVVALDGEIDLVTAPAMLDAILAADRAGGVVVDFSDVDFVGAAAVTVLVRARHLRSGTRGGIVVRSPTRLLTLMLDLFDLAGMIERGGTRDVGPAPR